MSNITRFDPFSRDFLKGFPLQAFFRRDELEPDMRIEVSEDERAYAIRAEIPGVSKEDIDVSLANNVVTISAEVKREREDKDENRGERKVIHSERYFGRVSRSFTLDCEVDSSQAQAKYNAGILQLSLPKKPGGGRRSLTIE